MRDPGEFMSTLKVDLYPEEVYCFTPKGRVIALPRDATPIDFAYAIHSDVGNTCVGAKVNGRIVQLKHPLRNGDVVEILTQAGHLPSKDWLAVVKTSRARNKIKHVINTTERAKAIEIGQKYLEREARRLGVQLGRGSPEPRWKRWRPITAAPRWRICTRRSATGNIPRARCCRSSRRSWCRRSVPEPAAPAPERPAAHRPGDDQDLVIQVKGIDDLMVYRAKCCNPIRGEAIVGYVTRGKGIAVHSVNCTNVQNLMYEVERKIDVEWARAVSHTFPVKLMVHTEDRPGMLNQLTTALFNEQTNIRSLEAHGGETDGGAVIDMTLEVKDKKQLERVVSAVRRISGVRDIERVNERP